MKKTTLNIPDEITWDLKHVCIREQLTQQAVIVKALSDYLQKYKSKNELPEYLINKN